MTVLLCGFDAFPGAPANPTADLVVDWADASAGGDALARAVLPVEWDASWPALERAIREARPRAVLLLGLAARSERVRVELLARNRRDIDAADAAGARALGVAVVDDGPASLPARLPFAAIARALRAERIAFEWSGDAGAYLCNDTFFRLAFHADALGVSQFGFLHMPLSDERVPDWIEAGALPERCRSVPAAELRRAATAVLATF